MPRTLHNPVRRKLINFRVSSTEFEAIISAASAKKMNISEYCRDAIVSGANTRTPPGAGPMSGNRWLVIRRFIRRLFCRHEYQFHQNLCAAIEAAMRQVVRLEVSGD